jgi:peptide/nickel transport system permease protein
MTIARARNPLQESAEDIPRKRRSKRLRSFARHKSGVVGAFVTIVIVLVAVFAPIIAPGDPVVANIPDRVQPPNRTYIMGTDTLGRDVFSRLVYGARYSLTVGLIAVAIATSGGVVLGLISGFYSGRVDMVIQRIVDMMMALPRILLAMAIVFSLGVGLTQVMIAVGISNIPTFVRVVRASVLSARENTYVEAARAIGRPDLGIMARHILPNVMAPIIVVSTLGVAGAILTAASLSFLGLGAQPPTPEWGAMISAGRDTLRSAWWISTFPGLTITIVVLAINLVGDALRDEFDPRLRSR